jgi:hypothetical protein
MRALLLLALAGCNEYYGLDAVKIVDAQVFDGPTMCSPLGSSFDFSRNLEQLLYDCKSYTEANGQAIALCREGDGYQPYGGPSNGPFTRIMELPAAGIAMSIRKIQLAPDGTQLVLEIQGELRTYRLVDGLWTMDGLVPNAVYTSNASSAPDRRILSGLFGTTLLHELSNASGTWQEVRTHELAAADVKSAVPIWLSGDARRTLVLTNTEDSVGGEIHIRYGERAGVGDAFQSLRILSLPVTEDVFITDDCTRAYFSGLRSIFYARRL